MKPDRSSKAMGWGTIVAIVIATSVGFTIAFGLVGWTFGFSPSAGAIGGAVGVIGAQLVQRRQAALGR